MSNKRVLLLLDASYQIFRASAAHAGLTHNYEFTGGLYGFMLSLAATIRETQATDVLMCCDRKPYHRSTDYPAYKRDRAQPPSKTDGVPTVPSDLTVRYQVAYPQVMNFCRIVGIPIFEERGFEADDLIAHTMLTQRSRYRMVYAASKDSDLYQLLWVPNFAIYRDKLANVVTRETVFEEFGLTPAQFALSTALQGTHNAIEGIDGIGPKKGAKIVKDETLLRMMRGLHGPMIERNEGLIKLPHAKLSRDLSIPQRSKPFDRHALYRFAAGFGIDVTQTVVTSLERINL